LTHRRGAPAGVVFRRPVPAPAGRAPSHCGAILTIRNKTPTVNQTAASIIRNDSSPQALCTCLARSRSSVTRRPIIIFFSSSAMIDVPAPAKAALVSADDLFAERTRLTRHQSGRRYEAEGVQRVVAVPGSVLGSVPPNNPARLRSGPPARFGATRRGTVRIQAMSPRRSCFAGGAPTAAPRVPPLAPPTPPRYHEPMIIDLASTDKSWRDMHRLYLGFVQPRPIAWVSTIDRDGKPNLAPFSFYNMFSANPPVVVFSPALNRNGDAKDTLRNIRETGEFVIATVTEDNAEKMNDTSTEWPAGQSEFDHAGLTPLPSKRVKPSLVKESPVNIECTLRQIVSLGHESGAGQLVFGDVRVVHVEDGVLNDKGLIDADKLRAVGRMGGHEYTRTTDRFELISIRDPAERK
jgi:flavin reductase (DIM6/NTAB) family NADH-FMN oxidoreductase RutF